MITRQFRSATALTALKNIRDCWNVPVYSVETTDAIRTCAEGVVEPDDHGCCVSGFLGHIVSPAKRTPSMPPVIIMTVSSQPATYVAQLASAPDAAREILRQLLTALASSQTDVYTVARISLRPTSVMELRHIATSGDCVITRAFICSSQELHRLQAVDDRCQTPRTSACRHTDNAEASRAGAHFVR